MSQLDDETFRMFLDESKEHLATIEEDMLTMEDQGDAVDEELVNKVFRAAHTIKGGAGFFAMNNVKDLAHSMENLLGLIRSGDVFSTSSVISVLLDGADLLKKMLNDPENMENYEIGEAVSALKNVTVEVLPEERQQSVSGTVDITLPSGKTVFTVGELDIANAQRMEHGGSYIYLLKYDMIGDMQKKNRTPWDIISEMLQITVFIDSKIDVEAVGGLGEKGEESGIPFYVLCSTIMDPEIMAEFCGLDQEKVITVFEKFLDASVESNVTGAEGLSAGENCTTGTGVEPELPEAAVIENAHQPMKRVTNDAPEAKKDTAIPPSGTTMKEADKSSASETIRVRLEQLDRLMTLAGEMVLTRNELVQKTASRTFEEIESVTHKVSAITSDLQEAIMATRMQSVGIVFSKFKRIVRDMARQLEKQIALTITGEEVELDRSIIEAIGDPLTHLVRNSVDHGIEKPDVRTGAGKNTEGKLVLRAYHKGGQVCIEIEDDGAGINTERVKAKALERKLHTPAELDAMSADDINRLIFAPGFSTAQQVTDISGRGVGMDVVRSNLSKVGGTVDLESAPGKGMVVRIKLPLTLAIVPSLLVSVQGERFAIPQVNLVELVRIQQKEVKKRIETIGDAAILRLRGTLLPLLDLAAVLDIDREIVVSEDTYIPDRRKNIADRRTDNGGDSETVSERRDNRKERRQSFNSGYNIVVIAAGDFHFGVIVDTLLDSEEIVVKPLGRHLKNCMEYAGATILGDGHVALILDAVGIKNRTNLAVTKSMIEKKQQIEAAAEHSEKGNVQSLLIVENGENEQFAIPLGLVSRIEKIHISAIENVGGKMAMTYRGTTMILLSVERVANVAPRKQAETLYVIVFKVGGTEVGIMVSEIVDVVDVDAEVETTSYCQPGILGAVIVENKITLMVDLYGLVDTLLPELTQKTREMEQHTATNGRAAESILVVEDSKFFLNQISSFLQEAGFSIFTAENGRDALSVLEEHADEIDLVLTDIEMPVMDGFEMTKRIRENTRYASLPVIAVTSVAGSVAEKRGREVGINRYLIKLDREQIIEECKTLMARAAA